MYIVKFKKFLTSRLVNVSDKKLEIFNKLYLAATRYGIENLNKQTLTANVKKDLMLIISKNNNLNYFYNKNIIVRNIVEYTKSEKYLYKLAQNITDNVYTFELSEGTITIDNNFFKEGTILRSTEQFMVVEISHNATITYNDKPLIVVGQMPNYPLILFSEWLIFYTEVIFCPSTNVQVFSTLQNLIFDSTNNLFYYSHNDYNFILLDTIEVQKIKRY